MPYQSKLITASASYTQQCYDKISKAQECSIFVKKAISPIAVVRNASCPFPGKEKICLKSSANLQIDSGKIDSHHHLGINAASKNRFTWRNVHKCAPLRTDAYQRIRSAPYGQVNSSVVQYMYGKSLYSNANDSTTFQWPTISNVTLPDYTLRKAHRFRENYIY